MKTGFPIILGVICLFYACQETIDFSAFDQNNLVVLNNPIRFDQLAVGQKSTYISIQYDYGKPEKERICEPNSDTLYVEIIHKDINGFLIKETTNIDTTTFFYYLDYYTETLSNPDSLGVEPNIEEKSRIAIITRTIKDGYAHLFRRLGAKIYLTDASNPLIEESLDGLCEPFFLPDRVDDPLPNESSIYSQHSELRFTRSYIYENNNFGNLLLSNHDYGFVVDGWNYNYGYSLNYGLVFSSSFRGAYQDGSPQIWHLIMED